MREGALPPPRQRLVPRVRRVASPALANPRLVPRVCRVASPVVAAADERIAALRREHSVQIDSINRLHAAELERQRELGRAATAARERQFERELEDAAALHKAQLTAYTPALSFSPPLAPVLRRLPTTHSIAPRGRYDRIESQGGRLESLASEVRGSAEALGALREKVDSELWKGVLKAEASLVEKEYAHA